MDLEQECVRDASHGMDGTRIESPHHAGSHVDSAASDCGVLSFLHSCALIGDIVASMSIRGLNDKALARLKRRAAREGTSLNTLVLRLLQPDEEGLQKPRLLQKFDDLDKLAGTWSLEHSHDFAKNTAAFSEVDPDLWK